ncbi:UNVERIFIED_CONTAM: hypothetical protein PYX00_007972 [Menopon gallinae]|uniref:rRNA adenine N(6)-methyltransferase n=1 Tax=Menopon gallinae TaxID=328185 RepID=A0AAW2HLC3_9NEOP
MVKFLKPEFVRLPPMPTIDNLLTLYGINAVKRLSQNFLYNKFAMGKFVKAAQNIKNCLVCEIGPGPGGITREIINAQPKQVLLIEKDERFRPVLESLSAAARPLCPVDTIYADILGFNLEPHIDVSYKRDWNDMPPNIQLIGNLPFDISTTLIVQWAKDISLRRNVWSMGRVKMTLAFQKEVGERLVAPILSRQRCRLSVMLQNYCSIKHNFDIPRNCFKPTPDVDASVISFIPWITPVIQHPFEMIEKVVRTIFSSRQKYVQFGVGNLFPETVTTQLAKEVFAISEIDPQARPFQLTIEEFGRIVDAYKKICDRDPRLFHYNFRADKKTREIGYEDLHENLEGQQLDGPLR